MNWLRKIQRLDWWLLGSVLILQTVSVLMMYGMSPERFQKQLAFAVLGIAIVIIVSLINYRYVQNYAYFLYLGGVILLVAVLIFGTTIRGTTGWFVLFGFTFQPVELVKILLIIALARYFSDHSFQFNRWKFIIIAFVITLVYSGLVLLQPDLGSMVVFTSAFIGLLLMTNIHWKQTSVIFVAGIIAIIFAWLFILQPYQKDRVMTFIDPSNDPLVTGYNVRQSIISVGSGQLVGRGLGLGTQSQLQFLPERDTDFIFAVVAEELGFVGASGVIILLGIILWRLWHGTRNSRDPFTMYYFAGLGLIIFVQSMINIGMNIGIMPVTGIPLPFISAGGSSLLALMLAIGIAQNCSIEQAT